MESSEERQPVGVHTTRDEVRTGRGRVMLGESDERLNTLVRDRVRAAKRRRCHRSPSLYVVTDHTLYTRALSVDWLTHCGHHFEPVDWQHTAYARAVRICHATVRVGVIALGSLGSHTAQGLVSGDAQVTAWPFPSVVPAGL